MFNSYEFVFDGESSLMYGLMIYDLDSQKQDDVSYGNKASIVETRTANRVQPLHFGVNYHTEPLQFKLVFGSENGLDRFDLEAISLWLTGHQDYKWLHICQGDLDHVEYHCLITELRPLSLWWLPVAFEATIICDCPYAYSPPWEETYTISGGSSATSILLRNESTAREYIKPILTFTPASGTTKLEIKNTSDNDRTFELTSLTSADRVYIDCNNGIIQDTGANHRNLYGGFNMNFPRLVYGDNALAVKGNGTLTLAGRFLHNVAG